MWITARPDKSFFRLNWVRVPRWALPREHSSACECWAFSVRRCGGSKGGSKPPPRPSGSLFAFAALSSSSSRPACRSILSFATDFTAEGIPRQPDVLAALRGGAAEGATTRSAVGVGKYAERAEINHIGSETGCHICGATNPGNKSGNFVPDHQPPSAMNRLQEPQRLYPQCINCSRQQGLDIARRLQKGEP